MKLRILLAHALKFRNVICGIINVAASAVSTLLLLPIIQRSLGLEAYGYAAICLSFTNIATISSVAITSVAARMVSIALKSGDRDRASGYFNTSLIACISLGLVLLIAFMIISCNIEYLIVIERDLVGDVRITLMVVAASLFCSIVKAPLVSGLYVTDSLYIEYIIQSVSQLARVVMPSLLFQIISPRLWIPYTGSLIVDVISVAYYLRIFTVLLSGIEIKLGGFRKELLKEILASGIWVSLSKTGAVLISTINLYLSNIILGPIQTGMYSAMQQLQSFVAVFCTAIVGVSVPKMYASYVDGHLDSFVEQAYYHGGTLMGAVCGAVAALSVQFMMLWAGSEFAAQSASIIIYMIMQVLICPMEYANQVFVTSNDMRYPALATIKFGIVNVIMTVILCDYAKLGILGLVLSQVTCITARNIIAYTPRMLRIIKTDMKESLRYLCQAPICAIASFGTGILLITIVESYDLITIILIGVFSVIFGLVIGVFVQPHDVKGLEFWSKN